MLKRRVISWLLTGAFAVSTFVLFPMAAVASPEGRKNTAMLLGGGAIYSLLKKKNTQGLILGAAGVYAYKRYKDSKSKRRTRRAYASGYRAASYRPASYRTAGYRSTYRRGRHYHYRNGRRYVCYRRH